MRISSLSLVIAFLILISVPFSAAAQETYLVFPFQAQGFDQSQSNIVSSLLRFQIAAQPGVAAATSSAEPCGDPACASKAIEAGTANATVIGELLQLGDKVILNVQVVRRDGTKHYSMTMDGLGEFDRIVPRLAESIVKRQSFGEAATVTSVTKKEEQAYKTKIEGDFRMGPVIGVLVPVGGSYLGRNVMYEIAWTARYEISHFGMEAGVGINFAGNNDNYHGIYEVPIDFRGYYYFSDRDFTPFVGASFGLHNFQAWDRLTKSEKKAAENKAAAEEFAGRVHAAVSGDPNLIVDPGQEKDKNYREWALSVSAFGGVEMLRTHTLHVTAMAGYRFNFIRLDGKGAHGAFVDVGMTF